MLCNPANVIIFVEFGVQTSGLKLPLGGRTIDDRVECEPKWGLGASPPVELSILNAVNKCRFVVGLILINNTKIVFAET